VRVKAADEDVIEVRATTASALARAAYHLGNRHVPLQVEGDRLVIGYDPVLVDMLVALGVRTQRIWAPFEPEAGAYAAHP
jgi:urease accessory protein